MNKSEILSQAAVLVLEQTAFLSPTGPCSTSLPDDLALCPDEKEKEMAVAVVECFRSALVVCIPRKLGTEIAASMLGCDPSDPDAGFRVFDAVGEVANMVAGLVFDTVTEAPRSEMKPPTFYDPNGWRAVVRERGLRMAASVSIPIEDCSLRAALFENVLYPSER